MCVAEAPCLEVRKVELPQEHRLRRAVEGRRREPTLGVPGPHQRGPRAHGLL
jgi:hypothetical protein